MLHRVIPSSCRSSIEGAVIKRLVLPTALLLACTPQASRQQHGVVIARTGAAKAGVVVTAIGTATKETGPAETVKRFGEVYAFMPDVFAVRRDQPTQIIFWNLQPDDEHDFMLPDPNN